MILADMALDVLTDRRLVVLWPAALGTLCGVLVARAAWHTVEALAG